MLNFIEMGYISSMFGLIQYCLIIHCNFDIYDQAKDKKTFDVQKTNFKKLIKHNMFV